MHISDMHLGVYQFGTGRRAEDVYGAFLQAIGIAIEKKVDFAVFCGDLFETPTPDGTAIMTMAHGLKKLKDARIPVFFILGDHDISHAGLHPVPFVYHKLEYAVHVGDTPAYWKNVMIAGVDKMRRADVDSKREYLAKLDKMAASHAGPKIMLAHQGIPEANKFATEITAVDLPKNFDYYAMGHIHDRALLNFDFLGGPVAYPGSTEVMKSEGVKDTKKGFYIAEIAENGSVHPEWIRLQIRPQRTLHADESTLEKEVDGMLKEAQNAEKKPIVEIRLSGAVRPETVRTQMARLEGVSFRTSCRENAETHDADVLLERPANTNTEMFRIAAKTLNSEHLAHFAVHDLLEPLAQGDMEKAAKIIGAEYGRFQAKNPD